MARASKTPPPANDMPPAAITDVRERIAATTPPQQMFAPAIHRGDCFEAMKSMADGSVDLILTDPPYSTTLLDIDPVIDVAALWAEYRRIIKPTGTIVMFGSQPFTSRLIWEARDLFKHDLVWIKNRATASLQARNRPLKQHEDVLVFTPGTTIQAARTSRRYTYNALGQTSAGLRKVSKGTQSTHLHHVTHNPGREYEGTTNNPRTTLYCPKETGGLHPFQKPLDLLEYLIRTYSNEGDLVLDTFMGSGGTCVAATRSGRRSIGIEMSEKYYRVARKRVEAVAFPLAEAA
jgi:site-specific DNA-methyltransferase (adenine-specific)